MTAHPKDGARLVLHRDEAAGATARYRVEIFEPETLTTGVARLDGDVEVAWDAAPPPAWIDGFLTRFLKSFAKKHGADGTWPRKITRWRAP